MNQHYASINKSNISPIRLLLVLAIIILSLQGLKAQTANGYVIYYNGSYLSHNASDVNNPGALVTAAATTFDPNTCLWTITTSGGNTYIRPVASDGTTVLGNYYLRPRSNRNNYSLNTSTTNNYNTWNGASSGSQPYYNGYYIRLNNNTWQVSTTNSNRAYIYQVTKTPVAANTTVTVPTISPLSAELNLNESQQFTASATATTTPAYDTYSFNNGNTTVYYFNGTAYTSVANMQASSDWTSATAAPTISYSWSLTGAANDYLTLTNGTSNPATVSYTSLSNANASSTLSVTATATANGDSDSKTSSSNATISVLPPENPNSISITTTSPVTIHVGTSGTVSYAFDPVGAYDNVTGTSSNSNVFTVGTLGGGIAVINPVGVGSAMLTLTAHKLNGDAITPSATITVNVRNKVVTPNISFEQIGDGATANTTITCGTQGATIYYKIDDAASWSTFTGSFVVDEYQEVHAYAAMDGNEYWDDSDVAHETYVSCSTANPVISYTSSNGTTTVTITAETGANIYYTYGANPNAPTTSVYDGTGTTSVTFSGPTNGQVVKAIAKNGSCATSGTVTDTIVVSGVGADGVVTLNDLEDHSWSYYQPMYDIFDNYPRRMCSPYPRNVKITYYGYGNNTLSLSEDAAPATNTFTTNTTSSQVKVGIGEDGNTFVYYKTLERDANNRFPYELIPNPFYVRPKSGNTYTGFYKWRIKSITNGAVYDASSGGTALGTGSMLDAETTYYFQPTDNARTNANNATSMEIELEALWAPAEISTGNTPSFSMGYNSVERNFYVGSGGLFSSTTPCTYSSFYPNGTTDGTTSPTIATDGTVNGRQTKASGTATADCKVEYMLLTGNTTADAYNLTLGRGIGIGTAGYFYPVNATKNVDLDFRLRIESGVYSRLYLMSDGNRSYQRIQNHFTIGSDYDRAKGDNSKLIVAQENIIKNGNSEFSDANKDKPTLTCIIKSGEFQSNYWYDNNNAQYNFGFYSCQDHDNASYPGLTTLIVEGGHFASIIGGRGNYTVGCITQDSLAFDLRFKGGLVENSIYGASSNNQTYGSRRLIFTGGEVRGWIAAGCNGTSSDNNGQTNGDSYVYVGGNTKVGNADYPRINNSAVGGNVFGAGRGMASQRAFIKTSHVAVADNAEVLYDVFGGGFHGYITTTSNIFILGGTTHGKVFGGGDNHGDVNATVTRRIPTVNINMIGGVVEGGVYGGSNTTGIVTDQVTLKINGGQVGTTSANATINGGGYGNETRVNGNVDVTLGEINQTGDGVTVYGDVYGGSALGLVNGTAVTTAYHTNVTLNKGVINGSLYGGGLGETGTAANVYGPVQVTVNGGSVNTTSASGSGAVYGCNNIYGAPQSTVNVDIYGTDPASTPGQYALDAVYGGGNQADYSGTPVVKVHNCDNSIGYVYGGGNAAAVAATDVTIYGGNSIGTVFGGGNGTVQAANVTGNVLTKIYGGTIGQVFGGSNSQGTIGGTITVNVDKQADTDPNGSSTACDMKVGEVYGGGNMAASKAGNISINCTGDFVTGSNGHDNCNSTTNRIGYELEGIGAVYGGANAAKVTGNITLNIAGGMIYRVFGGNNTSNTVEGEIVVNINKTQTCGWYVGYVYGGGNNAPYTRTGEAFPKVNILAGKVSHDVFGAGKGTDAAVTGNPVVTLTGSSEVGGNVYGGGDQGAVHGETKVEIKDAN